MTSYAPSAFAFLINFPYQKQPIADDIHKISFVIKFDYVVYIIYWSIWLDSVKGK